MLACFKIVFELKLRKNKSYVKPEEIKLWNGFITQCNNQIAFLKKETHAH